jgi:glycine/D-amino acid oxidase-like deaminating enzyme
MKTIETPQTKEEEWNKLPKTDQKGSKVKGVPDDLDWFDSEGIQSYSEMGTPSTTAQVHPFQFTTSMADLATEAGAKIIFGSVTAIDYFGEGVKGVTYEDKESRHIHTLPATDVILAAGPWTSHVFPEAPIEALRAHSVVVKADVSSYAVFSEIELPKEGNRRGGVTVSPEMYARPDGTVYACGKISSEGAMGINISYS